MPYADMLSSLHELLLNVRLLETQNTAHLAAVMVRQGLHEVQMLQQ